jgi:hypothetical protein
MSRFSLRRILEPHIGFLKEREIDLPPLEIKRGNYDFNKLSKTLMTDPQRPQQLMLALDRIGAMSDPHGAEILHRQLEKQGKPVPHDIADHDLAATAYLEQPKLFSVALQQKQLVDTRKFRCFRALRDADLSSPKFDDPTMRAMETALSEWFKSSRRGEGCEIIPAEPIDNCVWFMVIHGGTKRRTATFNNKAKGIAEFHPEQDDVLRLDLTNRRIWVHANAPSEVDLYRREIGRFIFGDETTFEKELNLYTLEPLRQLGRKALLTTDIEGCPVESIELREISMVVDPDNGGVWKISCENDLFDIIESGVPIPNRGFIKSARFRVKFHDMRETARVGILLPATAEYENDGHSEWIEAWLKKRGYWLLEQDVNEDSIDVAHPSQDVPVDTAL